MFCYVHYMISNDLGNKSDKIFIDLYEKICKSNLIDALSEIKIVTCGNIKNLKTNFLNYKKCSVINHCDDLSQWEFPTLSVIKKDCEIMDCSTPILYIHLKGVTSNEHAWRNNLSNVVINNHKECLEALNDYNSCGPMLCEPYVRDNKIPRHFSGNFWWSKSDHIKNLPNPDISNMIEKFGFLIDGRKNKNPNQPSSQNYRYLAEFWIGLLDMEKNHKLKEIV